MYSKDGSAAILIQHYQLGGCDAKIDQEVVERNEIRSEDSLLLLRLDLRWKSVEIIDQFVWDLANEYSDPDEFAAGMCKDLKIGSGKKNRSTR